MYEQKASSVVFRKTAYLGLISFHLLCVKYIMTNARIKVRAYNKDHAHEVERKTKHDNGDLRKNGLRMRQC